MSDMSIPMSIDMMERVERVLNWHLTQHGFSQPDKEDIKRARDFMVMLRTAIRGRVPPQEEEEA